MDVKYSLWFLIDFDVQHQVMIGHRVHLVISLCRELVRFDNIFLGDVVVQCERIFVPGIKRKRERLVKGFVKSKFVLKGGGKGIFLKAILS